MEGDPDDLLALEVLKKQGYKCAVVDWRNSAFDWATSKVTVLRSTWDYHLHLQTFKEWLEQVDKRSILLNDKTLVLSNLDKKYLLDLESSGITICPTVYIKQNDDVDKAAIRAHLNKFDTTQNRFIVKPSVGLSTYGVQKFDQTTPQFLDATCAHISQLLKHSNVLIQPYLAQVETYGERSLVYIDGEYSHSVRKSAFQKLAVAGQAGEEAKIASQNEIDFANCVIALLPQKPLYARVDVVGDGDKEIVLLELELTEPSLYLAMAEGAVNRFAQALVNRLTKV